MIVYQTNTIIFYQFHPNKHFVKKNDYFYPSKHPLTICFVQNKEGLFYRMGSSENRIWNF